MTGTITWSEDRKTGKGVITLRWEDGRREYREWDDPINAGSDSHTIADQFGSFDSIDHDGEFIHVSRES